MSSIHCGCSDAGSRERSVTADVFLRNEPDGEDDEEEDDNEEDDDGKEDADDEEDDDGYSE